MYGKISNNSIWICQHTLLQIQLSHLINLWSTSKQWLLKLYLQMLNLLNFFQILFELQVCSILLEMSKQNYQLSVSFPFFICLGYFKHNLFNSWEVRPLMKMSFCKNLFSFDIFVIVLHPIFHFDYSIVFTHNIEILSIVATSL